MQLIKLVCKLCKDKIGHACDNPHLGSTGTNGEGIIGANITDVFMPCEKCNNNRIRSRGAGMLCMIEDCENYGKNQEGVVIIEDSVLTDDEANRMHEIERLSEGKCGHMILTPTPEHNGGMWCAEKKPCKYHSVASGMKVIEEEWEDGFDNIVFGNPNKIIKRDCCLYCGYPKKDDAIILEIKSFIKQLLQKQSEEMVEVIEEYKKRIISLNEEMINDIYDDSKIFVSYDMHSRLIAIKHLLNLIKEDK